MAIAARDLFPFINCHKCFDYDHMLPPFSVSEQRSRTHALAPDSRASKGLVGRLQRRIKCRRHFVHPAFKFKFPQLQQCLLLITREPSSIMLANGFLATTVRRCLNTNISPEGLSIIPFGPLSSPVGSFPYFRGQLSYEFAVEGIEYGRGEGRTQGAANDAAAAQALSQLLNQYGRQG
ncbi:hypothetical protein BYT27DRAFT_7260315 [Phlegmacium glaucopus]|nr:hypothetical protein BYT27DRAFT_7260315 [Phlegmacium glaucopus]